jgi:hypothetical protein
MTLKSVNNISEKLLLAVKMQESTDELLSELRNLKLSQIKTDLYTDNLKNAFWINIYNSFFQILRKVNRIEGTKIFTHKLISIANKKWSLDDIEHGILRRFRHKYSLGYFPQLFASGLILELAVSKVDYRIHFALNCGAKSCPPIAFYSSDKIEKQLEIATLSFLKTETDYYEEKKEVHISRLFLWFMADFGGKTGIRNILNEKLDLNTDGFKLVYKNYSWDELLDNYDDTLLAT